MIALSIKFLACSRVMRHKDANTDGPHPAVFLIKLAEEVIAA